MHWEINGVAYKAGDTVRVTDDTVITAVFEDKEDTGADEKSHTRVLILIVAMIIVLVVISATIIN